MLNNKFYSSFLMHEVIAKIIKKKYSCYIYLHMLCDIFVPYGFMDPVLENVLPGLWVRNTD